MDGMGYRVGGTCSLSQHAHEVDHIGKPVRCICPGYAIQRFTENKYGYCSSLDVKMQFVTGKRCTMCVELSSDLVVVDVNKGNKSDSIEHYVSLFASRGIIPTNPISITPNGGCHWFYRNNSKSQQIKYSIDDYTNILSRGTYVMVPPSIVYDGDYKWFKGYPKAPNKLPLLPEFLFKECFYLNPKYWNYEKPQEVMGQGVLL